MMEDAFFNLSRAPKSALCLSDFSVKELKSMGMYKAPPHWKDSQTPEDKEKMLNKAKEKRLRKKKKQVSDR